MENLKVLTIILIILLICVSVTTFCMMLRTRGLIKEAFMDSNHNCYPYTSVLNARLSYNSPSKGWCTTGDYGDLKSQDDYSDSKKSSACDASGNYFRVSGEESIKLDSKAWCKSPQN